MRFIPLDFVCVYIGNIPGMFEESDTDCMEINYLHVRYKSFTTVII